MDTENKGEGGDIANAGQTAKMSTLREALMVAVLSLSQFCTQVGVGGPLAILHVIGEDLQVTSAAQLSWLMAAYSLAVGTFILPSGRFGDVFGHKLVLIIGFYWFAISTLIAGLAIFASQPYILFVLARVMQGVGSAICLPNALAILGRTYKQGRKKDIVFAFFGATAPIGSVFGAVSTSLWARYIWWPWALWSFALVLAATATIAIFIIPPCESNLESFRSLKETLSLLDGLGAVTGVAALILFSFAWNEAPVAGWSAPSVTATLVLGLVLMLTFILVENGAAHPLIPIQCLNGNIAVPLVCVGLGWSCFGIFLYYTWQFFELLRDANPLLASAWYSANGVSGAVAALLTGVLLRRVGASLAMVIAMLAYVVGTTFIVTAPVQQTYWANSFLCLLVVPFGMDISFPAATVMISDALPADQQGMGASLVNTVVNYSISLGLGVAGTVEKHVSKGRRTPEALLNGYKGAWYTGIGLSGLGLAISLVFLSKSRTNLR